MGSADPRRCGTVARNDITQLVRCPPVLGASPLLEGTTMTTDVGDRLAWADEVLADVRDLDEVREPDEDARARAAELSMPDLRGARDIDPHAPHPWRSV